MNHLAADGTALVRPLYHLEPRRDEAYRVPNEYAFGSELLVAPIVEPRDPVTLRGRARAWLPPGSWTDVFTGTTYAGDRFVDLHRSLEAIPVLLRAGGILPLAAPEEVDATVNPAALEVLVAPGASGSFTLVEDREAPVDGSDRSAVGALDAGVCRTTLTWDPDRASFRIDPAEGDLGSVPGRRRWRITFLGAPAEGQEADAVAADRFSVDLDVATEDGAELVLAGAPTVGVDARDAARVLLERAQAGNAEKLTAWAVVDRDTPRADRIAELETVDVPASLRSALVELLGSVHPTGS
jgi:hypothetical protein